jgi:anthrone oxygenase-like protein
VLTSARIDGLIVAIREALKRPGKWDGQAYTEAVVPEIIATGIFTGAAVYVNLVEHPARLSCGVQTAVTEWRPSYKRGTLMQAPLAVVGSASAFISWWFDRSYSWLVGGVLLLLIIPFTLIVILPTNKRLESQDLYLRTEEAGRLLRLWSRLSCGSQHPKRSGLCHLWLCAQQFGLNPKWSLPDVALCG